MEHVVALSLTQCQEAGKALHDNFVSTRIEKAEIPISDIIRRNNFFTFKNRPDTKKKASKIGIQKQNTTLITQLFLSLQSRPDADIAEFFFFENQREPPTLSNNGMLRSGQKSDIIRCVGAPTGRSLAARNVSMTVMDGPAVVHMVKPTKSITFKDYVPQHIVPFLQAQITATVTRIDLCWDTYPDGSLKVQTQTRRGSGPRTQLGPDGSSPIPKREWNKFLANTQNKKELFSFISTQLSQVDMGNLLLLSTKTDCYF
jgi:hypothetical protein